MTLQSIDIYTDGACKGNPGPGGWGALLRFGDQEKELFGGEPGTTNNRMELMAVIEALEALKRPCHVVVHTDSQYVQKGISEWIHGWKKKGWVTAAKTPVKNADLWKRLDELVVGTRDRMALGQGPCRPPRERARRRARQPRRRIAVAAGLSGPRPLPSLLPSHAGPRAGHPEEHPCARSSSIPKPPA